PRHLVFNSFLDYFFIIPVQFCNDRHPVWRRGINNREVTGSHQRELQCPWYGRRGQGQRIHICFQLFKLILYGYAESLFLINYQETKIPEPDILTGQPVSTDNYVYFSFSEPPEYFFLVGRFLMPAYIFDGAGEIFKT